VTEPVTPPGQAKKGLLSKVGSALGKIFKQ
jgi:hypothetical protein